jgi:diaminobutyrate-2-oxoglutarate transaminase
MTLTASPDMSNRIDNGDLESAARYYHRVYPVSFARAVGSRVWDSGGREYLDLFGGAGAMNLGHNLPEIKAGLVDYLSDDGLLHGLDVETPARAAFRDAVGVLLARHDLPYKFLCSGPTGANAVEAALKIARRATGRSGVIAFTGAFHGMSLGALSVTSNGGARTGAGIGLPDVTFVPFPGAGTPWAEGSLAYLTELLDDSHSGVALPAAIILESVQAEGGVNPAPIEWLRGLSALCQQRGILLISDDIQVGCSRTGFFFSFEAAGVTPDIVVMAKALSGIGLPLSMVLYRSELDVLEPGQHNGTFRGNQLAFVAAAQALPLLDDPALKSGVLERHEHLCAGITAELQRLGLDLPLRGRGLIIGLDASSLGPGAGSRIVQECFQRGVIAEGAGRGDQVVKLMPPLNIAYEDLDLAASVLGSALGAVLADG